MEKHPIHGRGFNSLVELHARCKTLWFWVIALAVVAALGIMTVIPLSLLYTHAMHGRGLFRPHFSSQPSGMSLDALTLSCDRAAGLRPADMTPHDANLTSAGVGGVGANTELCLFSGDTTTSWGVHESQVAALCTARSDCAGYVMTVTAPFGACMCQNATTGVKDAVPHCVPSPFNNGYPLYRLIRKTKSLSIDPVRSSAVGKHHTTRITFYEKL